MDKWLVEFLLFRLGDEHADFLTADPGPHARKILKGWCRKPGTIRMTVEHRPSRTSKQSKVDLCGRYFRAYFDGRWMTLEAAVKEMKKELEDAHQGRQLSLGRVYAS